MTVGKNTILFRPFYETKEYQYKCLKAGKHRPAGLNSAGDGALHHTQWDETVGVSCILSEDYLTSTIRQCSTI